MKNRAVLLAVALASAASLIACGSDPSGADTADLAGAQAADSTYPVEVLNCGRTLHFDRSPTRIVSGWPSSTELLIDLGVGDRVVGKYNTANGTPADDVKSAYDAIPTLGDAAPSREALLAAKPDLIWADGDYLFDGQQLPTIDQLNADGIQVMILSGFCTSDATAAKVRDVQTDLAALGTALGVQSKAKALSASVEDALTAATARRGSAAPVDVAMVTAYDGSFTAYDGVYSDLATAAGAHNVYAGALPAGKYYNEISVEDLLRKNPPVIVFLTNPSTDEAAARQLLAQRLPTSTAVTTGKVIYLPDADSTNLRVIDGVKALSQALYGG